MRAHISILPVLHFNTALTLSLTHTHSLTHLLYLLAAGELAEFKNKAEGIHTISNACGEAFEGLKLRRKHKFVIFKVSVAVCVAVWHRSDATISIRCRLEISR